MLCVFRHYFFARRAWWQSGIYALLACLVGLALHEHLLAKTIRKRLGGETANEVGVATPEIWQSCGAIN
jgi:hypothetical protein